MVDVRHRRRDLIATLPLEVCALGILGQPIHDIHHPGLVVQVVLGLEGLFRRGLIRAGVGVAAGTAPASKQLQRNGPGPTSKPEAPLFFLWTQRRRKAHGSARITKRRTQQRPHGREMAAVLLLEVSESKPSQNDVEVTVHLGRDWGETSAAALPVHLLRSLRRQQLRA